MAKPKKYFKVKYIKKKKKKTGKKKKCITSKKKRESFPGGASGKEPACQCRRQEKRVRSLGQEDPLEEGMALQDSCLESPTDRGAWRATVRGVAKSWTRLKRLSTRVHWPWSPGGSIARWKRDPGEGSPQREQVWLPKHWKWGQGARLP